MPTRRLRRLVTAGVLVVTAASGLLACSNEPERSVANYCSQVSALTTLDADLASGDPVAIQARADDLRRLQQVSPPEIEPSVAILLGITDDFVRTAGTAINRAEVADEVFRGRNSEIASIEAAASAVTDYTATNCQIDLPSGSTSVPGSATTPSAPGADGGGGDSTTTSTAGSTGDGPTSTTTSTPSLLVD